MHRPVQLPDQVAGCPAPSIFQLGSPCVSGFPRTAHASAALATNLRVAPNLQSIRCAGNGSSSYPDLRIIRAAGGDSSGCPASSLHAAPLNRPQVAPRPALRLHRRSSPESPRTSYPSAVPTDQFTRLPRVFSPSVSPTTSLRVAPNSVSSGTG